MNVYDGGAFTIDTSTWGYQSFDADGKKLVFSATEWECEFWSRRCLKARQEGWTDEVVAHEGTVGGKL